MKPNPTVKSKAYLVSEFHVPVKSPILLLPLLLLKEGWSSALSHSLRSPSRARKKHSMPLSHSISGARLSRRLLADPAASTGGGSVEPPNGAVNSDVVVILAALLCTLICLVGLGFMARCACRCPFLRRFGIGRGDNANDDYDDAEANKGLKKKAIRSLPVAAFDAGAGKSTDCAICLSEFLNGEQVRVLPRCGHCFHLSCIGTWLASHSSCPSCRLLLSRKAAAPPPSPPPPPTVRRCQRCGLPENISPAPASDAAAGGDVRSVDQESSAEKLIR